REGSDALRGVNLAADRVGKAADDLSLFSRNASTTLSDLTAQGGTISRLNSSLTALSTDTLPRITRLADDASHTLRRLDDVAGQLQSNPQALLYGNGPIPPGPGEAGFSAAAPQR
ncbi:MAG: MCE family protein, partial [Ottowia sp.]|nr:MCE family protein [Ottowia sp.]